MTAEKSFSFAKILHTSLSLAVFSTAALFVQGKVTFFRTQVFLLQIPFKTMSIIAGCEQAFDHLSLKKLIQFGLFILFSKRLNHMVNLEHAVIFFFIMMLKTTCFVVVQSMSVGKYTGKYSIQPASSLNMTANVYTVK